MSDVLGATLPEDLLRELRAPPSGARCGEAILIATADGSGRPHPALLSHREVRARDGSTLRGLARFEAAVEEVRRDRARDDLEGATKITSGITFRVTDPAAKAQHWAALHEALA